MNPVIETILDDRPCTECGYNLRGLSASGVCPECGSPVSGAASAARGKAGRRIIDETELGQCSLSYLLPLGMALCMCGLSGMVLLVSLWNLRAGSPDPFWIRAGSIAAVLWLVGALILLRDRPAPRGAVAVNRSPDLSWPLKLMIVLTQPALAAIPALYHLEATGTPWAAQARIAAWIIACIGLPAFPVVVSFISDWAMDASLTLRLRYSAWALGVGAAVVGGYLLVEASGFPALGLFVWLYFLARLAWVIGFIAASVYCLELLIVVRWAVINAKERADSARRLAERRRRWEESMKRTPAPIGTRPVADAPASVPPTVHPIRFPHEKQIERPPDVQPYGLEETRPPDSSAGS